MGFISFFRSFVSGKTIKTSSFSLENDTELVSGDVNLHEYGIFTVVDYIATLMQQAQWETYKKDKQVHGGEWYAWNVRPNCNQSAAAFWYELTARLLLCGEALVFEHGDGRFIMDSAVSIDEGSGVEPHRFYGVGRQGFQKPGYLLPEDVLYFKYDNTGARAAVAGLCQMYNALAKTASEEYQKSGGVKGFLNIEAQAGGTDEERRATVKLLQERFQKFLKAKNAVMPLNKGYSYSAFPTVGSASSKGISDISALQAESLKLACSAYHMPYGLISGEVAGTSEAWELATATVLSPLRQIFETEINGTLYTRDEVIQGTKCECNISRIKPVNIIEKAEAVDKLISSGYYTVNELREATGEHRVNDETADKRFITKNYSEMEEMGGEKNES